MATRKKRIQRPERGDAVGWQIYPALNGLSDKASMQIGNACREMIDAFESVRIAREKAVAALKDAVRNGELTQSEIARRLHASRSYVNDFMSGNRSFSMQMAHAIIDDDLLDL